MGPQLSNLDNISSVTHLISQDRFPMAPQLSNLDRGASSHFCFEHFVIVYFHSALWKPL